MASFVECGIFFSTRKRHYFQLKWISYSFSFAMSLVNACGWKLAKTFFPHQNSFCWNWKLNSMKCATVAVGECCGCHSIYFISSNDAFKSPWVWMHCPMGAINKKCIANFACCNSCNYFFSYNNDPRLFSCTSGKRSTEWPSSFCGFAFATFWVPYSFIT